MIPIHDLTGALQAKNVLDAVLQSNSHWIFVAATSPLRIAERNQFELRVEWGRLVFAFCEAGRTQTWRVVGYQICARDIHILARCGIARDPIALILRSSTQFVSVTREEYASLLARLLERHFNHLQVKSITVNGDRRFGLPAGYARLVLHYGGETILAIGVVDTNDQRVIDGIIAAGLIWLTDFNIRSVRNDPARALWFCLPHKGAEEILERLTLISAAHLDARVECIEIAEEKKSMRVVSIATQIELLSLRPHILRWPRIGHDVTDDVAARARILQLAPDLIEVRPLINGRGERYSIHGLEFARWERGQLFFGVTERQLLVEENERQLETLVQEISLYRRANSIDRRHRFYRLRSEAWLESLLRRDIRALDPTLNTHFIYSQVPTWHVEERSVVDLLTIDCHGRLVVIEIKATEDINLPLQGLNYWLRIEEARRCGEFKRRGLFCGIALANEPPRLYLVTPRLRFHKTFAEVARCLSPAVEAYRVGINADWRRGVRVHIRERAN